MARIGRLHELDIAEEFGAVEMPYAPRANILASREASTGNFFLPHILVRPTGESLLAEAHSLASTFVGGGRIIPT